MWREYTDSDVRIIRSVSGATINDVVLATLAMATRKYLEDHPDAEVSAFTALRTLVPVNVRRAREQAALGNRISFLPIDLPLNIPDPIDLLNAIHEQMREHKAFRVADSISLMFDALHGTSVAAQAALLGAVANPVAQQIVGQALDLSPANMICTNIPGPQIPLYVLGHRLLAVHGEVPTCLGMGVNCCVITYDQKVSVSIVGDGLAAGDAVAQIMANYDKKFRGVACCGARQRRQIRGNPECPAARAAHALGWSHSDPEGTGNTRVGNGGELRLSAVNQHRPPFSSLS